MSEHKRAFRPSRALQPVHPEASRAAPDPGYPSLAGARGGTTRRGFLAVALGASAAAVTRCMGAAPSPRYPRRWQTVTVSLPQPAVLTGCAGATERQTYQAVAITSTRADLVRRLGEAGGRAGLQRWAAALFGRATCDNSTLAAQVRRVEESLADEVRAWYRQVAGVTVPPSDLRVTLKPGPMPAATSPSTTVPPPAPSPPRSVATD